MDPHYSIFKNQLRINHLLLSKPTIWCLKIHLYVWNHVRQYVCPHENNIENHPEKQSGNSYWKTKTSLLLEIIFLCTFLKHLFRPVRHVTCLAQPEGIFKAVIMHNGGDLLHYYIEIWDGFTSEKLLSVKRDTSFVSSSHFIRWLLILEALKKGFLIKSYSNLSGNNWFISVSLLIEYSGW